MIRNIRISVVNESETTSFYRDFEIDSEIINNMTVMDLLRFLSRTAAPDLVFYDHSSCGRGLCGRCGLRMNGKACLACNTVLPSSGTIMIEPLAKGNPNSGPILTAPE